MVPVGYNDCFSCDVLVVGAGPAGTTAAFILSGQGFSTAIIEKDAVLTRKVCGDLLGPRALGCLEEMQLLKGVLEATDHVIRKVKIYDDTGLIGKGSITGATKGPGYGIVVERDRLDERFRRACEKAGTLLFRGTRLHRIEKPSGEWIHSYGRTAQGERRFRSRIILGADGVHSTVARQTGLLQRIPSKMILAQRCYFEDVPGLDDGIELYFQKELLPGYGWVIPLDERTANVGMGIRADVCMSGQVSLRRRFNEFVLGHRTLSKRLKEAKLQGRIQAWPIGLYGQAHRNYAPHVLLVGDAGNFADPLSGEGIYGAIESARQAAITCSEALRAERFDAPFLKRYEGRWKRVFHEDFHYADLLVSFPSHRRVLSEIALWGIRRLSRVGVMDEEYGSMVTGLFCGIIPRKMALRSRFIAKTLFT